MAKHLNITIYGRIQRVGFRYFINKTAEEMGICGFVRNRTDGAVYVEAEGRDELLEEFCKSCKKGNAWAKIKDVQIQESELKNFTDFDILVK